jgi:hypothetical protein
MKTWTWSQAWSHVSEFWHARPGWLRLKVLGPAGLAAAMFVTPFRRWLVDATVVVVGLVLVAGVIVELVKVAPVVEPISVPKSLVDLGYSGDVVAARLIHGARKIEREANASRDPAGAAATGGPSALMAVIVPNSGVSVGTVADTVRSLFGSPASRISGEIVIDESGEPRKYRMRIRMDNRDGRFMPDDNACASVDQAIESGAQQLAGLVRPCALADFLYRWKSPQTDPMIKACFDARPERDREWAHNLTGLRYAADGNFKDAIEQYNEALKRFPNYAHARNNLENARLGDKPKLPEAKGSPPRC